MIMFYCIRCSLSIRFFNRYMSGSLKPTPRRDKTLSTGLAFVTSDVTVLLTGVDVVFCISVCFQDVLLACNCYIALSANGGDGAFVDFG